MKGKTSKMGWVRRHLVLSALVAVVVAGLAFVGANLATGAWTVQPILSGSMRPGFPTGGLVVTQREPLRALAVREVVVTHPPLDPHSSLIHRVVSVRYAPGGPIVSTKGDDNPVADPWEVQIHSSHIYVARFTLPLLGYPAVALHSPDGRRTTLAIAGILFLLGVVNALAQRRRNAAPGDGRTAEQVLDFADETSTEPLERQPSTAASS